MNKFVILAFAIFALGFYELSGGADFDPETARNAAMEARQTREAARSSGSPAPRVTSSVQPAAQTTPDSSASDTRPGLNLPSFASVANRPAAAPDSPVAAQGETSLAALAASVADQDAPLGLAALNPVTPQGPDRQPPATQAIVFPGSSLVASSSEVGQTRDVRVIKGSRVNMRAGPGTDYEVVDQLPQATRVEVLTDTGNGWVELRPVEGGPSGWIAAFLLDDG